jgi:hypothetical protein
VSLTDVILPLDEIFTGICAIYGRYLKLITQLEGEIALANPGKLVLALVVSFSLACGPSTFPVQLLELFEGGDNSVRLDPERRTVAKALEVLQALNVRQVGPRAAEGVQVLGDLECQVLRGHDHQVLRIGCHVVEVGEHSPHRVGSHWLGDLVLRSVVRHVTQYAASRITFAVSPAVPRIVFLLEEEPQ